MKEHNMDIKGLIREDIFLNSGILQEYNTLVNGGQIDESYNLYTNIEDDVEYLTKCIIDTIATMKGTDGSKEFDYTLGNLSGVNKIVVNIENIELHRKSASISVDGDTLTIDIVIGLLTRWLHLDNMYDIMYYGVEKELVHELTHGKIQTKQKQDIAYNDTSKWYDVAYEYIKNGRHGTDDYLYMFFYSLYASYYEEVQAYASEATHEVGMKIKDDKSWDGFDREMKVKTINIYLQHTNGHMLYYTILHSFLPKIKKFDEETMKKITSFFNINGCSITEKEYNDFVKQIEFACNRALTKMNRGLIKYYNQYDLN